MLTRMTRTGCGSHGAGVPPLHGDRDLPGAGSPASTDHGARLTHHPRCTRPRGQAVTPRGPVPPMVRRRRLSPAMIMGPLQGVSATSMGWKTTADIVRFSQRLSGEHLVLE